MKSHLSEDSDDENCEDLIRLVDNDINAVYFGSRPHELSTRDTESCWMLEPIGNDEFCQPIQNCTLEGPDDDLISMVQRDATSECDITPLCVKLVDCGKFPWYFRKYTQQIMQKINSNDHGDSDHEIDVENNVDDPDDCFIVEDLKDVTNELSKNDQNCMKTVVSIESPPKVHKIIKRRRDSKELQIALSQKNMYQVDFKRNVGLVGMKITRKIGTNITTHVKTHRKNVVEETSGKQKCVMAAEKYVSAAIKTLSHINTEVIPITDERESNTTQLKINNEKDFVETPTLIKSSSSQNLTVQFEISKISKKLIKDLITKKTSDQSSQDKIVSKVPNKSLYNNPETKLTIANDKNNISSTTEKIASSTTKVISHVKDVKKTNKYKNDQMKIKNSDHRSLIGLLVANKSKEDIKEINCTKQKKLASTQSIATKLDKKLRKKIEKQKHEPKSPILHCSTVPKKPKSEMHPKCNKTDPNSNLPKEPTKVKKIVDRVSNLNSCSLMHEADLPKHVIPKIAPVKTNCSTKQALQKEPMIQEKPVSQVSNIHAQSMIVADKLPNNCNEVNKTGFKTNNFQNPPIAPSSLNKSNEQNVFHETRQDKVNNHTINTVPVTNPTHIVPNKSNKPTVSNSNVSTTTAIMPTSGTKHVISNQYASCPINHGSHIPVHNPIPSRLCSNNYISNNNVSNNNINGPIQNGYVSAIISKSHNHKKKPYEKFCEPPLQNMAHHPQKSITIPTHKQQQWFKDPQPPYPIYYPPAPSGRLQSYFPCPANSVSNQFQPPHGHIAQQQSNPMQNVYREFWWPQNLTAAPPPPPPPCIPPTHIPPRNDHDVNKSKNCSNLNLPSASVKQIPQNVSHQNSISTSIIGMNNDGLVKKINIVSIPAKNNIDNKQGMVKLEQITNSQNMIPPEDGEEVVATKREMLKELDKLSFVDENIDYFKGTYPAKSIGEDKIENTLEVAINVSQIPGRFETLKVKMDKKDNPVQINSAKGYSSPILPIPTFQKVLNKVTSNSQIQNTIPKIPLRSGDSRSIIKNETKPMRIRDFVKNCKRKLNNAWSNDEESRRKEEAKKISLNEYKKRILKNDSKPEHNKKKYKEKYNNSGKTLNIEFKFRENVDNNTETDLGYDSDSTVVL